MDWGGEGGGRGRSEIRTAIQENDSPLGTLARAPILGAAALAARAPPPPLW